MNADKIIVEQFVLKHHREAALVLEGFETGELARFFGNASIEVILALVPEMNPQIMLKVIDLLDEEKVVQLFDSMDVPHAELLIRMMGDTVAEKILSKLSAERSIHIRRSQKYPLMSVGSHVDQPVFTLNEHMTVKEAMTQARRFKTGIEPTLFVLTSDRKIVGVVKLSNLITENPKTEIRTIMQTHFDSVDPEIPVRSALNHVGWEDHYVLPVVKESKVLLGVISLAKIRAIQRNTDQLHEERGLDTIGALGDLYQIGLAGLLRVATDFKTEL